MSIEPDNTGRVENPERKLQKTVIKWTIVGSITLLVVYAGLSRIFSPELAEHLLKGVFFGFLCLIPFVSNIFLIDEARDSIIRSIRLKTYGLMPHPSDMIGPYNYIDKQISSLETFNEIRQTNPDFLHILLVSHFVFGMGIYYGAPHWRFLTRLWE